MKRRICFIMSVLIFTNFIFSTEFSIEKPKKVTKILNRIAKRKNQKSLLLRKITFSESEFNSYLNHIYTKKFSPEVKYVKIRLRDKNRINGFLKIKLEGKKYKQVPSFLKNIEVEIDGNVFCENYRMRIDFKELKINGTSFAPEILDEAFSAAQSGNKIKKSMYDWFRLLPGIKKIQVNHRKITFFY